MGHPTVYPTGVTIYDPERSWSGYTIFQAAGVGALLIDMNVREVQLWGAAPLGRDREVVVEGVKARGEDAAFCVIADADLGLGFAAFSDTSLVTYAYPQRQEASGSVSLGPYVALRQAFGFAKTW